MAVYEDYYFIEEDSKCYKWNDEMFAHNFEYGEKILVRDKETVVWNEEIFVGYIDGAEYPFNTVTDTDEKEFRTGKTFSSTYWRYACKIHQPRIKIICKIDGERVPLHIISEETLLNIRKSEMDDERAYW